MSKTVVGLFSTVAEAEQVKQSLTTQGYDHVTVVANDAGEDLEATTTADGAGGKTGIGEKISNFFHGLTGGDEKVHHHYATGINSGGALLALTTTDDQAAAAATTLKQMGARDIDSDYEGEAEAGTPVYGGASSTATSGEVIPVVEEELVVGKREVDRGGVRVYSRVAEVPVSTDVTLREEHITLERRPVSRVATAADFTAGRGGVVELTATGEEAVVGKTARVVEEVVVGKEASQRTEAIHDSVRRTEVEVEELPAAVDGTTKGYLIAARTNRPDVFVRPVLRFQASRLAEQRNHHARPKQQRATQHSRRHRRARPRSRSYRASSSWWQDRSPANDPVRAGQHSIGCSGHTCVRQG